jgi:hypothetical protein
MNDDQLHRVLRQTPAQIKLPTLFGRSVWARIEAEASFTFSACLHRLSESLFATLARPLPASLTIAASIALGAWLGGWGQAEKEEAAQRGYIASIHPLMKSSEEDTP